MSGVVDTVSNVLFGSSEDAKQVGTASTLTPGQSKYLEWLTDLLQGNISSGGVAPYPGQISPGESPLQSLTFDRIQKLLEGETGLRSTPEFQAGSGVLQQILGTGLATDINQNPAYAKGMTALDSILKEFDPGSATEFWQKSFVDPALKTWNEEIAPAIQEKYTAKNAQYSSAMPKALAKSGKDLMTNLSGQLGEILYNAEQAQKNRQATGATTALNFAQLPATLSEAAAGRKASGVSQALNYGGTDLDSILKAITAGITGGEVERGIEAGTLQEGFQKWLASQPYSNPWLQYLSIPLGVNAVQPIVQGPTQTPGLLTSLLGGAGAGIGMGAGSGLYSLLSGSGGSAGLAGVGGGGSLMSALGLSPFSVNPALAL